MNDVVEKVVYLVRHGQSEANAAAVFQGLHSPLSEVGQHQAQKIAQRVQHLGCEALIASPLVRTKQTAEAITAITGLVPEYSDLFVERIKPARLNDTLHTDEAATLLWHQREESLSTPSARIEDGENFDDIVVRADNALTFLQNRSEKSLVVVTHGYFLKTIAARVMLGSSMTPEAFKHFQRHTHTQNTGLTVLKYKSGFEIPLSWHVWIYNDHAHLGD